MRRLLSSPFSFLFISALAVSSILPSSHAAPRLAPQRPAATEPTRTTPLESPTSARALVQQLMREGKIISGADIPRGTKGYALSVFQGTKVEKFNIEVLGTLERVRGGADLVMIRVLDGPVVQRQSGIIEGMSGSPVYINGKLLGAIAIGFNFPKEPIGGVTPISQMIQTALPDNVLRTMPVKMARAEYTPKTPLRVGNRQISRVLVAAEPGAAPFSGSRVATTMTMRPCANLVQLSGVSGESLDRWKRTFAPYGVTPVLGGGQMSPAMQRQVFAVPSRKTGVTANLAPGAAIGVQLASGDVDATSVGTVTFRDGNRVLAFGHPLYNLGAVSMPMSTAFIHDIFPAYDASFKLASSIKVVGELQQDANFAVGGTVGRTAQTIPLRIRITDPAKKLDRRLNVKLIKDPIFTPELLTNIAADAVESTLGLDSNKTVKTSLVMRLSNAPTIRRANTSYAPDAVLPVSLGDLLDSLSITQQNPYEKGALAGIDLDIEVLQGRHTAHIRRIFADRNRVKAGETMQVSVELEPIGSNSDEIITKRFSVPVPDDAPSGLLRIAVSPADAYWSGRARVGGAPPRPANLRELVDAYSQIGASNQLVLQASTPRRFLLVDRKKVPNPPALWSRIVPAAPSTSLGTFNETIELRQPSEYVLSGLEFLTIPVESTKVSDRERPDSATTTPSSSDTTIASLLPTLPDAPDTAITPEESEDGPDDLMVSTRTDRARQALAGSFQTPFASLRAFEPLFGIGLGQGQPRAKMPPASVAPLKTPATPTPTPTPTATPTPTLTPDATDSNIARPVGRWIQKSAADFRRGQFTGAVVRDDGTLMPGPSSKLLVSSGEPVAWSLAVAPDGTVYVGTGHSARLLKIQNGKSTVMYQGPEVAVSALALDKAGNLYAGVSPGGRVYRFAPDGTRTLVLQSGETFVHALVIQGDNLLIATGGERGALYRVSNALVRADRDITPKPFATVPQHHIRSLALVGDTIFAGCGDAAVLYRIAPDGTASALYQAAGTIQSSAPPAEGAPSSQVIVISPGGGGNPNATALLSEGNTLAGGAGASSNEILAVAPAPDGDDLFFGTLASGTVFRWSAKRGVQEAWKSTGRSIYALLTQGSDVYAACDGGEVWRLTPAGTEITATRVLDAPQPQVIALTFANGRLDAATANNAAVYEVSPSTTDASYLSNVFDAGQIVRFGALRSLGSGDSVIETRSGNVLEPDATWSAFAPLQDGKIVSVPARYLQYRVKFAPGNSALSRVEALFRAPNRAPRVTWTSPTGGEYLSGKKTLTWSVTDPDSDPTRAILKIGRVGLIPTLPTESGLDTNGNVTLELKDPTQNNFELDTTKYPDGTYQSIVTVSDAARNPDDPQMDTATTQTFTIDNTAPKLEGLTAEIGFGGEGWKLRANGSDATSPLAGAEWRVVLAPAAPAKPDAKTPAKIGAGATTDTATVTETVKPLWQAMSAEDGIFDSKRETLVATLDPTLPGASLEKAQSIEVRLRDAAGNMTTATVSLPVRYKYGPSIGF